MELSPSRVKSLIKKIYGAGGERISVILLGPPGVGKTQLVEEVARELAAETGRLFLDWRKATVEDRRGVLESPEKYFVYVAFSATHVEPIDLSGIPRADKEFAEYRLLDFQHVLTLDGVAGILFLDEFTTDPRADRRASELKIINENTAGFKKFSEGVLVVAAGNTKRWSELAEELDEPMRRGRACIVFVTRPTLDEWVEWMNKSFGESWDRRIFAFLKLYPDKFFTEKKEGEEDGDIEAGYRPLNSPRNWTKLAVLLAKIPELEEEELGALVKGFVEPETAVLLSAFLQTAIPEWKMMKVWDMNMPVEAKYLLLSQMAMSDLEKEFDRAADILRTMDTESLNLLLVMMDEWKRSKLLALIMRHLRPVFDKLKQSLRDVREVGV